MHSGTRRSVLYFSLLVYISSFIFIYGCRSKAGKDVVFDKPLAAFQVELLNIAFKTATAIPAEPHLKDRSRTQQEVVNAALELGQPLLAEQFTKQIHGWRQGVCWAQLAIYCTNEDLDEKAEEYLKKADELSELDYGQNWRNNRIKGKMLEANTLLGHKKEAEELKKQLAQEKEDESGRAEARAKTEGNFEQQAKVLDEMLATGDFELVKWALKGYAVLFDKFYNEPNSRDAAEEKIRASWGKITGVIVIEIISDMVEASVKHNDNSKAVQLLDEADVFIAEGHWPLEYRIPITAKFCKLRFKAGDSEKSRADVGAAFALFNAQKSDIIDIYRAETICPLGQAYKSMGDTTAALSVYKLAIEEGAVNTNPRPRAEDLSATCCSMALYAVEPDSELWTRIHQISEGLGKPW